MKKIIKILSISFLSLFFFNLIVTADSNITVVGNQRISINTIINNIGYKKNKEYSVEDINEFQKKLIETNFFSDVEITNISLLTCTNILHKKI